jgi:hypothetical protein
MDLAIVPRRLQINNIIHTDAKMLVLSMKHEDVICADLVTILLFVLSHFIHNVSGFAGNVAIRPQYNILKWTSQCRFFFFLSRFSFSYQKQAYFPAAALARRRAVSSRWKARAFFICSEYETAKR